VSVAIRAVLWEPNLAGLRLSDHEWRVFELPAVGSHYWHDKTGYRVDRIEEVDGETRVHFMRDPEWEEAVSTPLPDEYLVDGGRSDEDGHWHFQVVGPQGIVAGANGYGIELEPAIRQAVVEAATRLGLAPGQP
jgi:hypothetical protein